MKLYNVNYIQTLFTKHNIKFSRYNDKYYFNMSIKSEIKLQQQSPRNQ